MIPGPSIVIGSTSLIIGIPSVSSPSSIINFSAFISLIFTGRVAAPPPNTIGPSIRGDPLETPLEIPFFPIFIPGFINIFALRIL